MWKIDATINPLNLGQASTAVPDLHAKYLEILMGFKLQLRKTESEYLHLRRQKRLWYSGEMGEQELKALEWPQYLKKKVLKSDMEETLATDDDIIKKQDLYDYVKNTVYALESILKSIASRGWDIKTALEYEKFVGGM